jgi:hypothetical protein
MNAIYKHLKSPLYAATGKHEGGEDWFNIKDLEQALDRWVNEGGYFVPSISVLDLPSLATKAPAKREENDLVVMPLPLVSGK